MGCPGGMSTIRCTRLVLEIMVFHCMFLGGKAIIISSKHCPTISTIFFPIAILFHENFKKKCPERRALNLSEYTGMCSCPPGHPIILLKSN